MAVLTQNNPVSTQQDLADFSQLSMPAVPSGYDRSAGSPAAAESSAFSPTASAANSPSPSGAKSLAKGAGDMVQTMNKIDQLRNGGDPIAEEQMHVAASLGPSLVDGGLTAVEIELWRRHVQQRDSQQNPSNSQEKSKNVDQDNSKNRTSRSTRIGIV